MENKVIGKVASKTVYTNFAISANLKLHHLQPCTVLLLLPIKNLQTCATQVSPSEYVLTEPPLSKHSGVGLLFRKTKNKPDYLAFMLASGSSVSLMRRSKNRLKILWTKKLPELKKNEMVKLKISGHNSTLKFYINDKLIQTEKNVNLKTGDPGIFAYSIGCFVYDDFALFLKTEPN